MIPVGVIEGFYGRVWSQPARLDFAAFARQMALDFYIYAPKACGFLRKNWLKPWPAQELLELTQLRDAFADQGIAFGVGFSPFGAAEALTASQGEQATLQQGIESATQHLNRLELDYLCILFDDMPVHLADLAQRQIDLVEQICSLSNAKKILVCPSFYSFDPRLEEVFGAMPKNYWADLGRGLKSDIDIFWTGDKVCSDNYLTPNTDKINTLLQRRVFLWDNYPVNDGRLTSPFLHLSPSPAWQSELGLQVSGLAANPMNAAYLSQIPLAACASCFKNGQQKSFVDCLDLLALPQELKQALIKHCADFEHLGLQALPHSIDYYLRDFAAINHPMASEVRGWLQGHYKFDPECLTD